MKYNLMLDIAGGNSAYTRFLDIRSGTVFNGESDNNVCFGGAWESNPILFDGSTLALWQSSTGNDLSSSIENPLLYCGTTYNAAADYSDPNLYKPQAGSPVIDAGGISANALDFDGKLRDSACDIGAFEY